jgi:hypothetical protein
MQSLESIIGFVLLQKLLLFLRLPLTDNQEAISFLKKGIYYIPISQNKTEQKQKKILIL